MNKFTFSILSCFVENRAFSAEFTLNYLYFLDIQIFIHFELIYSLITSIGLEIKSIVRAKHLGKPGKYEPFIH